MQMSEALNSDEKELFSFFKGQWVHRFGVDSLPALQDLKSFASHDQQLENFQLDDNSPRLQEPQIIPLSNENDLAGEIEDSLDNSLEKINDQDLEIPNHDDNSHKDELANKSNNKSIFISRNIKDNQKPQKFNSSINTLTPPLPQYNYLRKWLYS